MYGSAGHVSVDVDGNCLSCGACNRCSKEAQLLSMISHPNVVEIFGVSVLPPRFAIHVMNICTQPPLITLSLLLGLGVAFASCWRYVITAPSPTSFAGHPEGEWSDEHCRSLTRIACSWLWGALRAYRRCTTTAPPSATETSSRLIS